MGVLDSDVAVYPRAYRVCSGYHPMYCSHPGWLPVHAGEPRTRTPASPTSEVAPCTRGGTPSDYRFPVHDVGLSRESRGRRPPGSSSCRRCWLGLGGGPSQGAGQPVGQSKMQGPDGWQDQPSIVDQAAVVKGDADAVGVVASIGWSWSGDGFVLRKPLSPKHRSALLTPLARRDTHLLGGLGLIR